jgi:hypothetical protein
MSEPARRGFLQLANDSRTFLTAAIALVAAAIGLLFQLVPALKPDPRERVGASVEIFSVEPGVRLGDWIEEAFPKNVADTKERVLGTRKPDPSELAVRGTVVYVRAEVDGYKHRAIGVRARLYDVRSQRRVAAGFPARYDESSRVEIDAPNRRSVQLLFLPDLRAQPEQTFLRVELQDSGSGALLAVADSPPLAKGRIAR